MSIFKSIKRLGGETVIYGLSGAVSRFISVFLVPVYTRAFTPAEYGITAVITAVLGLIGVISVLGLDMASVRWFFDSQDQERRKSIISSWFWSQFNVSLVIAVLMHIFAAPLSALLFDSTEYASLLRLVGWMAPLATFPKVVSNWLRFQQRAWATTIFFISTSLGTVILTVIFILVFKGGLLGLFQAQFLAALITALAALFLLDGWVAPRRFRFGLTAEMLRYSAILIPAAIASWVTTYANRFFLQFFRAPEEVGLYTLGYSIATVIALVINAFYSAWLPFALSIQEQGNSGEIFARVLSLYTWLSSLLCVGLSLFTPLILRILATPSYYGASSCVPFLAFSFMAQGLGVVAMTGVTITKKSSPLANSFFIGAGVNTLLNLALIPFWGMNGAAIAAFVAQLAAAIYLFIFSQKHYYIPYRFHQSTIILIFSFIVLAVANLLFSGASVVDFVFRAILCLSFIPLAFFLGLVTPQNIQGLLKNVTSLRKNPG